MRRHERINRVLLEAVIPPSEVKLVDTAEAPATPDTPMDFLHKVMNDKMEGMKFRIEAAKALAPYVHQQKARDVNVTEHKAVTFVVKGLIDEHVHEDVIDVEAS